MAGGFDGWLLVPKKFPLLRVEKRRRVPSTHTANTLPPLSLVDRLRSSRAGSLCCRLLLLLRFGSHCSSSYFSAPRKSRQETHLASSPRSLVCRKARMGALATLGCRQRFRLVIWPRVRARAAGSVRNRLLTGRKSTSLGGCRRLGLSDAVTLA